MTWQGPHGAVRATPFEHAVPLVGYDENNLYVNDPLRGTAAVAVTTPDALASWDALGRQTLTIQP